MSQIATISHIQALIDNEVYITFRYLQKEDDKPKSQFLRTILPLSIHVSNKTNRDLLVGQDMDGNVKSFFIDQIQLCSDVPQAPKRRRLLTTRERPNCARQLQL